MVRIKRNESKRKSFSLRKKKSKVDKHSALQKSNDSHGNNAKSCTITGKCAFCDYLVTMLEKLSDKPKITVEEMRSALNSVARTISHIKGYWNAPKEHFLALRDPDSVVKRNTNDAAVHSRDISNKLIKLVKKRSQKQRYYSGRLNKSNTQVSEKSSTNAVNKILISLNNEAKVYSSTNHNSNSSEIDIEDELLHEKVTINVEAEPTSSGCKSKDCSSSNDINQTENHDFTESSSNFINKIPIILEKNSTATRKNEKCPRKNHSSFLENKLIFGNTDERETEESANFKEKIYSSADDLLGTNLENKIYELENLLDSSKNNALSMTKRKNHMIKEYTNNLDIIIREKEAILRTFLRYKEIKTSDLYHIFKSCINSFFSPYLNVNEKNMFHGSSETLTKNISEQHSSRFERKSSIGNYKLIHSENIPEKRHISNDSDTNTPYDYPFNEKNDMHCNVPHKKLVKETKMCHSGVPCEIKIECAKTFFSKNLNVIPNVSSNISDTDCTKATQLRATESNGHEFVNNISPRNSCSKNFNNLCDNLPQVKTNVHPCIVCDVKSKAVNELGSPQEFPTDSLQQLNSTVPNESVSINPADCLMESYLIPNFSKEGIIFKYSCNIVEIVKEYENPIISTSDVEYTIYNDLIQTAKRYSNICGQFARILQDFTAPLTKVVEQYFKLLNEYSSEFCCHTFQDEDTKQLYRKKLEIIQKFQQRCIIFLIASESFFKDTTIFFANANECKAMWLNYPYEYRTENVLTLNVIKKSMTLLRDCYNSIYKLRLVMEAYFHEF